MEMRNELRLQANGRNGMVGSARDQKNEWEMHEIVD